MDERDRAPGPSPATDAGKGALTGATGSLTPDDGEFVPAETREISDPGAARDITAAAHRRRQARAAGAPDDPGRLRGRQERIQPNDRDGGYGSEHGLAGDDPAYREEEHLPAPSAPPRDAGTRLGGDRMGSPDDEHL